MLDISATYVITRLCARCILHASVVHICCVQISNPRPPASGPKTLPSDLQTALGLGQAVIGPLSVAGITQQKRDGEQCASRIGSTLALLTSLLPAATPGAERHWYMLIQVTGTDVMDALAEGSLNQQDAKLYPNTLERPPTGCP